jgi:hypothetical protein
VTVGTPRALSSSAVKRTNVRNERLIALFLLGVLLFNYPLLAMFNAPTLVLGVPKLYLYLFAAWGALIAGAALVLERTEPDGSGEAGRTPARGPTPPR